MPQFGLTEGNLGVIPVSDPRAFEAHHRDLERRRMNIPTESIPIQRESARLRVFIYNVSPWRYERSLGSLGTYWIPSLAKERVLQPNDFSVSEPLIVPGLPAEYYPSEGRAVKIEHLAPHNSSQELQAHPGLHLAMEIVGKGTMVDRSEDITVFGIFVSTLPEQKKPGKGEDPAPYEQWAASVRAAQKALRKTCAEKCQEANQAYARGQFAMVRDDKFYDMARLIRKTEIDCPWLKDTEEAVDKKPCISCAAIIPAGTLKCRECGDLQVSQAEYDRVIKMRRGE